ncbi:MAG TPA: 30S ribosomal protein S6 [Candidatus Cybelea sp.]|jgi:small subunit ribosomal protein S6|nr:30S ribosomal protein S6 [Candidatus Cybelea sp.]
MTNYEVTYILRPSLEESEVEERANAIAEIVKGQGGEVTAVERLGKKRLAYEINDSREGNYVVMQFTAGSTVSKELDRQLKLHEDVLRGLIIKLDAKMLTHMAALAAAAPPQPHGMDENVRSSATYVPHR